MDHPKARLWLPKTRHKRSFYLSLLTLSAAVAILMACICKATGVDTGKNFFLRTGDSEEVTFPIGTDLSVSRRGVVDLFHLGEGRWQLTALRSGFVVIDPRDAQTGEPRFPRLFVEVKKADDEAQPLVDRPEIPAWICATQGVICTKDSGLVSGWAPSLAWHRRAKFLCQTRTACQYEAKVPRPVLDVWASELSQRLGVEYQVLLGDVPVIKASCAKPGRIRRQDEVDLLTDHSLSEGLVLFRCLEDEATGRYRLSIKVYLVEGAAAKQLGFEGNATWSLSYPKLESNVHLLSQLRALELAHQAEIIAQPTVRMTPNVETTLTSGGEFQVIEHVVREEKGQKEPSHSSWKEHGLALKLQAVPKQANRATLTYDLSLKSRMREDQPSLIVNSLRSDLELQLSEPTLAAILDMRSNTHEQGQLAWLSKMPFIGPLFEKSDEMANSSHLFLWFELAADQQPGPQLENSLPKDENKGASRKNASSALPL